MFIPKEGMKVVWRSKEKILLPYSLGRADQCHIALQDSPNQGEPSLACLLSQCPFMANIQSDYSTRACQNTLGTCP